jgi:DnaJ-class molecular chaperone
MDRWGVGNLAQAFAGYAALPAPVALKPWYAVLGYSKPVPKDEAEAAYRRLAKLYHPDSATGDAAIMSELNRAISEARAGGVS